VRLGDLDAAAQDAAAIKPPVPKRVSWCDAMSFALVGVVKELKWLK
jgi:hypothetical protein